MFVDPSGRGKDETSYACVKVLHGRMFLVAAGGFLGGYEESTLKSLLMVAKEHSINKIICEPNYGGGMFTSLLKSAAQKYYAVGIEDAEWSSVAKEQRIVDTLEPVLNQHRLVVCPSVIESDYKSVLNYSQERAPTYRLFYQLARMVRMKGALSQDDRIDALAGAVSYWQRQLARDTERAVFDHREQELQRELDKFVKHAIGGKGESPRRWASRRLRSAAK